MTSTSRRTFCLQSLAAGLSAVTLLSGCAVTPQNARVWRGRFSLRITAADGRLENQTGRFELTKTPQFLRLDLLTPHLWHLCIAGDYRHLPDCRSVYQGHQGFDSDRHLGNMGTGHPLPADRTIHC